MCSSPPASPQTEQGADQIDHDTARGTEGDHETDQVRDFGCSYVARMYLH
jgi:hypothetical protein